MRDEAHFSWDEVEVGADDRALVLRSIHSPSVWSSSSYFNRGRAEVEYLDDAVRVVLLFTSCPRGETGAARTDDPAREFTVTLEEPVVYWHGGVGQLDRIDARFTDDSVFVTVLEARAGRMAGRSKAALLHLDEPLRGRRIRRGTASR